MKREPPRQLQILSQEEPEMIRCAPDFQSDAEYEAWLEMIHEEIPNEGENDVNNCQEEKD